ncbi:helix-turn-helix domain-containing protein [Cellulomonas cellasea]|uniref:ArsR family transcriptional regulator n=1 Tax=Cellulomonas cellasea DSM 20118 TaxID=1408250 RepID=A0A0A0B8R5_9CELL|nr:helix-turn-helix domain-containing protein [Cellulomonas cellasea]KGM01636.1 ArsR family transcriptional regulator [Cellulomonas cellasea DSM 20118]
MPRSSPIAAVVMHPVRLRIIQIVGTRRATTTELRTALPDVPQATLYRHVAALVEADVLAVVGERRVRGAVERTLALGGQMAHVDHAELREMDEQDLRLSFLTFLANLGETFDRASADGVDGAIRDFLGFGQVQLHVTSEDLGEIQARLGELLAPYLTNEAAGTRTVTLATVLLPEPQRPT